MLRCLETLPRRTKIVLRNSLTKRYPAVPLPSTINSSKTSEDNLKDSTTNNNLSHDYDIDIGDNLTYLGKMLLFYAMKEGTLVLETTRNNKIELSFYRFSKICLNINY